MATQKISVTIESDSIRVDPETLTMNSLDDVHWAGTNSRMFSIVFDNENAFGQRELAHAVATRPQRPKAKGRFKYTVVSAENPSLKLDPVIIIEDPPTKP